MEEFNAKMARKIAEECLNNDFKKELSKVLTKPHKKSPIPLG